MRIATDKDWQMDVRNGPESWKTDLDQQHQCKHYLYRGEAIFYGTYSVRRPKHCGMRRQSSASGLASNQNSGKGVLFSAESNGMVQIPDFRQAHHYKTKIFGF